MCISSFRKEATESKKASPLPAKKLGVERSVKFKLSYIHKAYIPFLGPILHPMQLSFYTDK